jgi:predicted esterase
VGLPQTAALALSGPQAVPFSDGGRSWFTFFDASCEPIEPVPGEMRRVNSLRETIKVLQMALDSVAARAGWSRRRIHLFGFSQGGAVALELARVCAAARKPVGSVVAVCSGLLTEALREIENSGGSCGGGSKAEYATPVLLLHGDREEVVSPARVKATEAALRCEDLAVTRRCVAGKRHAMVSGPEESRALMQFYAENLSQRPPGDDVIEVGGGSSGVRVELATDAAG